MKRIILLISTLMVAISAIAGGIGLIVTNGLGMYASSVQPIFYSYFVPGLILSVIVGGTHLVAFGLLVANKRFIPESVATAGFGLVIWLFFEIYITNLPHFLQLVYLGIAILELVLVMLILKERK